MKKILLLFILITILIGCCSVDEKQAQNTALIEKYVQAVENNDTKTMESLLDENYLGLGPSVGDSINKSGAISSWKNNLENLYENITYVKSRIISVSITEGENQGEWVSNWAELNINYKNNKREVTIWANTLYQIENNKIIKSYTIYNEADVLEQLGFIFINPNDL